MWKYAIRKLLLALPVLLGITIIDYAIMCMAGSPLDMMISPRASQEAMRPRHSSLGWISRCLCNMCAGWGRFCRATWVTRIRAISLWQEMISSHLGLRCF